jgi:ribosomal protein S18 acetylase RimI-like enzyme
LFRLGVRDGDQIPHTHTHHHPSSDCSSVLTEVALGCTIHRSYLWLSLARIRRHSQQRKDWLDVSPGSNPFSLFRPDDAAAAERRPESIMSVAERTTIAGKSSLSPPVEYVLHVLRPCESARVDEVVRLVRRCYRGLESWTTETGIVEGPRVTREDLLEELKTMDVLAALSHDAQDAQVLGCIKTGLVTKTVVGPLVDPPATYVGMLAVDPAYQSRGLATSLINAVEQRAVVTYNCPRLVMDVLSCRDVVMAWYKRAGYLETGRAIDARPFMEAHGEKLLVDCSFLLLQKILK